MSYSDFDVRMKKYEYVTRNYLYTRTPVIIRVDGKAFHTFTKGLIRPFDEILSQSMQYTMEKMCENIQGCVLGYTQSDEISFVLVDYQTLETSPWFDYNIQKCTSVASSMATMYYNRCFGMFADIAIENNGKGGGFNYSDNYLNTLINAKQKGAMFDARVFNLPKEEVCNYLLWRQNDAVRNSVQMTGMTYFSSKELYKKSCDDIKEMLLDQKGIAWSELPKEYQRGSCCIKRPDEQTGIEKWIIDKEIPLFKGDGRLYVNDLIYIGE